MSHGKEKYYAHDTSCPRCGKQTWAYSSSDGGYRRCDHCDFTLHLTVVPESEPEIVFEPDPDAFPDGVTFTPDFNPAS